MFARSVVAGRRLKGVTSCYVRLVCQDEESSWGRKTTYFEARTQICAFGSAPVFNDAPFKFRFKRVTGIGLTLTVVATDGPERALYEWSLSLTPVTDATGWVEARSLTGVATEEPPQLNLQVTFRYISEPLHIKLLRPYLPEKDLQEIQAQTGKKSVLSPSEEQLQDWLRRMPPPPPEWQGILRLSIMCLIIISLYVVPGYFLFAYNP